MRILKAVTLGVCVLVFLVGFFAPAAKASPVNGTVAVTYWTVAYGDKDFATQCCGTFSNMVLSTLGPDGLPLYNSSYGGPALSDVNSHGEITWWSPAFDSNVTFLSSGTASLPFANGAMFGPSGNDSNSFLVAEFKGTFVLPSASTVQFTLGSDDDSFFYVDGQLVDSNGGVHANTQAPVTTSTLTAGSHTLTLFYADRYPTQASLNFALNSQGITVNPGGGGVTPEPGSILLLGTGLLGLGLWFRRRKKTDTRSRGGGLDFGMPH